MSTSIDLKIGMNLEVGSVPVSLDAEVHTSDTENVYKFDGCLQTAHINIGDFMSYVGQQFGVEVKLPPELKLEADIDYIAAQVIYTSPKGGNGEAGDPPAKPTTELGAAAKFDLIYSNGGDTKKFTLTFYADTILTNPAPATGNPYVVGGAIDMDLKFADLPLVGSIPVFNKYTLKHLGFSYTNTDPAADKPVTFKIPKVDVSANPLYTRSSPDAKNSKDYSISTEGNNTNFNLAKKGFALTAGLMKEGSDTAENNFALPMALPSTPPPQTPASYYENPNSKLQTSPPGDSVHWININKKFGPVDLQKIGLNYAGGEATFGFSAGFSMGAFALDVQGLTITFPLPLPKMPAGKTVSFDIQGLAMDYSSGSLTIGGAFAKVKQGDVINYFGEVIVQVGSFGFKAIGGYAPSQNGNPPAFFLYASLEAPLGGPPFLYVTGLAFGFGVNYALILPTIETLPGYLFLPGKAPEQGSAKDALGAVISTLVGGQVIQYKPGQYWVGAGVEFTSFDMVSAFAMLVVSFGVEFQIGLIGSCSITLPKGAPYALAQIEVDLVASFTPSTGLLAVAGVIAPSSYIFGPFVKLQGGFAFYTWFSGDHKGDFVVSLGGYHPAYNKPPQYPAVPRIQISFNLGPFQAAGQSYVALTPSMFMAGVKFMAQFTAGPIKAWFSLGADFMIGWAPFMYNADAYVNIGCDINLGLFTISIHIGADVQIWGPPFGGVAHVDLDIISFTISFGSDAAEPAPVTWQNIQQNFLPKPSQSQQKKRLAKAAIAGRRLEDEPPMELNVSASVQKGLITHDIKSEDGENWNWILDPDDFEMVTATTIPANKANWMKDKDTPVEIPNDPTLYNLPHIDVSERPYLELVPPDKKLSDKYVWEPTLNIKPMKLKDVKSVHTVTVFMRGPHDGIGEFTEYITTLSIDPVLGSNNTALWGDPDVKDDPNMKTLIVKTLTGFELLPVPRNPSVVNAVPLIMLLFTRGEFTDFGYITPHPDDRYKVDSPPPTDKLVIDVTGLVSHHYENENMILSTLVEPWVTSQRNDVLTELAAYGYGTYKADEVKLEYMGTTEALTDWPHVSITGKLN